MKIRKLFKVESAHIVRNCSSVRCSHSIHGHSAKVELIFENPSNLDNAQMVIDFGILSQVPIKEIIDAMDHCLLLCNKDDAEYLEYAKKFSTRWIEFPFNPTAEMLSLFVYHFTKEILTHIQWQNGEDKLCLPSIKCVRYHETETGWAECDSTDDLTFWNPEWDKQIKFSEAIMHEFSIGLLGLLTLEMYGSFWPPNTFEKQIEL